MRLRSGSGCLPSTTLHTGDILCVINWHNHLGLTREIDETNDIGSDVMDVTNEVMPTSRERITEMMAPGPDGPIFMVNLLKFKEHAEYEDGRATDLWLLGRLRNCGTRLPLRSTPIGLRFWKCRRRRNGRRSVCIAPPDWLVSSTSKRWPRPSPTERAQLIGVIDVRYGGVMLA